MCTCTRNGERGLIFSKSVKFTNNKTGFNQLLKWSRKHSQSSIESLFLMEATGVYYELTAHGEALPNSHLWSWSGALRYVGDVVSGDLEAESHVVDVCVCFASRCASGSRVKGARTNLITHGEVNVRGGYVRKKMLHQVPLTDGRHTAYDSRPTWRRGGETHKW